MRYLGGKVSKRPSRGTVFDGDVQLQIEQSCSAASAAGRARVLSRWKPVEVLGLDVFSDCGFF